MLAVSHKEVVTAVLGVSAGLAGFSLVFLGVVLSAATFDPGTKQAIVNKALVPARAVVVSFGIGVACLVLAMVWLLLPRPSIYWVTVSVFFCQLASLAGTTAWVVRRTLWG